MDSSTLEKLVKRMYSKMLEYDDKAHDYVGYIISNDPKYEEERDLFRNYSDRATELEDTLVSMVIKPGYLKEEVKHDYQNNGWVQRKERYLPRFKIVNNDVKVKTPDEFWEEYKEVI